MFLSVRSVRIRGIWRMVHWDVSWCKTWSVCGVCRTAMAMIVFCCLQGWSSCTRQQVCKSEAGAHQLVHVYLPHQFGTRI